MYTTNEILSITKLKKELYGNTLYQKDIIDQVKDVIQILKAAEQQSTGKGDDNNDMDDINSLTYLDEWKQYNNRFCQRTFKATEVLHDAARALISSGDLLKAQTVSSTRVKIQILQAWVDLKPRDPRQY